MRPEERTFRFPGADGRELTFFFDHRAMIATEKAADDGFANVMRGVGQGRLGYRAALIFGGLRAHHPEITPDAAWELMEEGKDDLLLFVMEAVADAMPERKGGKNPPRARKRGNGSRSSPRGSKKG